MAQMAKIVSDIQLIALIHVICVLFGAPWMERVCSTFAFSLCLWGMCVVAPRHYSKQCFFGRKPHRKFLALTAVPWDKVVPSYIECFVQRNYSPIAYVVAAAALAGSLLAPLDWDVWWQYWPVPSAVLACCVFALSFFISWWFCLTLKTRTYEL